MSNGESTIQKVEDTDISSSDEDLSGLNDDLNNSTDIDALHKLLGDTFTAEANDSETMIGTEHDSSLTVEDHSLSALEELELLFGDSTVSDDEDFLIQTSEQSAVEEDISDVTALDELKAFLDDSNQAETGDIETSLMSTLEHSFENRRSVLDELQNLLQSCLDELKADTKSTIDDDPEFSDAVYPSRDELQGLLETMLSQLLSFADSSMSTTSADSASVLDELKNFMHETDEHGLSSTNEGDGMENMGSDSIIDELNLLLGGASPELFDTPLENDYSMPGVSDGSPVQDELAAYMAELADDNAIDDGASVEELCADPVDAESDNASNTLEELEAMLNEIGISSNDKAGDSIKASEDDFSFESEERSLFADNNEKKKVKTDNKFHNEVQSIATVAENTAVNTPVEDDDLLCEQDSNNRIPIAGLLLATVGAVAIYGFWSLLDSSDVKNHLSEKNVIKQQEPVSTGSSVVISAEEDSIYELLAKTETSGYVPISSYEDEPLYLENTETDTENKTAQNMQEIDAGEKTKTESKELISLQMKNLQQENKENINQLSKRMSEAEISIALLQVENKIIHNQTNFVEPQGSELSEVPDSPELSGKQKVLEPTVQKVTGSRVQVKDSSLWSVHLSSYYGKPPPAGELEYLENAGISYEIKKAVVDEKVWYRVIVDDFSAYAKAMEYSNGIRKNVGRDDIWVNRSQ